LGKWLPPLPHLTVSLRLLAAFAILAPERACQIPTQFLPLTTASDIALKPYSFREIYSTTHCIDYSNVSELSLYPIPVEEGITRQTRQQYVVVFGVFKQFVPISNHTNFYELESNGSPKRGALSEQKQ
jgi:hypothetical protein